jgi:integrase
VEYEGLPSYLKPIIATAICTGLRKGEILNLKGKNVDTERDTIYIRENKQNRLQIKYLNDDLIDLFEGHPCQRRVSLL